MMLFDIEVFHNFFCIGIENYLTGDKKLLEVSEEKDDREEIIKFLINTSGYLVSFNGISYDETILAYIIMNWKKLSNCSVNTFLFQLKVFNDKVINDEENFDQIKYYRWYKKNWISIDLFLYWAKSLRLSKKISLKALAVQLNYPIIQELPYHPEHILTKKELPILRHYNITHDLGILRMLLEKMKEEVNLRKYVNDNYGLQCWSMDAPKITSEILLQEYCNIIGDNPNKVRKLKWNPYYESIYNIFKDCIDEFSFKTPILKKIYEKVLKSNRSFNEDFIIDQDNTLVKMSLGIGGCHTLIENAKYSSNKDYIIISSDVASLYPNIIDNKNICRFPEVLNKYKQVKVDRLEAKKNKEKLKDTFLKLQLNGFSGLLDQEASWLYYPEGALKMRIYGQMLMMQAMDIALEEKYTVLALNTDSIDCLVHRDRVKEYINMINSLGKRLNFVFEHEEVEWTYYKDINNYIQKTSEGKIKRKGMFKIREEIPLADSVNQLIIPFCLTKYFVDGISPEEIINNPDKYNLHIYDFCCSKKISKDYEIIHNNKKQQQLNRYYFSKSSPYLYKKKKGRNVLENVHVGLGVEIFNEYKEKEWNDYKINTSYYIKEVKKIIDSLNNNNQGTLF